MFLYLSDVTKRNSSDHRYENVHMKEAAQQYENVFDSSSTSPTISNQSVIENLSKSEEIISNAEAAEQKQEVSLSFRCLLET